MDTSRICSWTTACACSALLTTSLLAAEPFPESFTPPIVQQKAPARITAPQRERAATGAKPATSETQAESTSPQPLDLPLSEFGRGRNATADSRPARPAVVKPVPGPYFQTSDSAPEVPAQAPSTPLISLPDFLETSPALAEGMSRTNLLPPEPIAETAQLVPGPDTVGANGIPGMTDTVFRPISQIEPYYDYSPTGKRPYEYICPQPSSIPDNERARCPDIQPLPTGGSTHRHFALVDFQWLPTDVHHKPLYFQDVALERYGQKFPCGLQPFVSVGKFAVQGIGLPYQIALDPVWRDIYPLGYYRPGDNAPELIYQVPINMKAAAAAGGVYTGLIFLFP